MKIKHKLIQDFQYITDDKKIFILKKGTTLEDYTLKVKTDFIPVDKAIIDGNPDYFGVIEWRDELLTHIKTSKLPQPAIITKKLIPFIEEIILSNMSKPNKPISDDRIKELDKKEIDIYSKEQELIRRENLLKISEEKSKEIYKKEIDIKGKEQDSDRRESDVEIKEQDLIKRENQLKFSLKDIENREDTLARRENLVKMNEDRLKDIDNKESLLDRRENRIKLNEDDIEARSTRLQKKESDYKEDLDNLLKREDDIKDRLKLITDRELELEDKTQDLNERERNLENEILKSSNDIDGKYNELQEKISKDLKSLSDKEKELEVKQKSIKLLEDTLFEEKLFIEHKVKEYNNLKEDTKGWREELLKLNKEINDWENLHWKLKRNVIPPSAIIE